MSAAGWATATEAQISARPTTRPLLRPTPARSWHYSYGNYVEIDHGNGYRTLYGHMSEIAVTQGQAVSQGQTIGYVGSTGNSTGNHCHFEMSYNGALFSAYTLFPGM